jgi:hypothetical protein
MEGLIGGFKGWWRLIDPSGRWNLWTAALRRVPGHNRRTGTSATWAFPVAPPKMLIEFDQTTIANMTAALDSVCERIPPKFGWFGLTRLLG